MSKIKSFEELACYQAAREFRRLVSRFCKTLPKEEEYRLKDQMIRSSKLEEAWKVLNGYIAYLQRCAVHGVAKIDSVSANLTTKELDN